ncbi:L,D-transpeptidase [Rhizobium lusitanum]|uniref:Lipoprotein-anchoring transpeptidase ErfK/SrfK n=1 Tax=Rhizobium lusitanum TaxID=293958 RepID=A0A7X0ME72_9HYPH|nr:L,D-transpeptidase [Rhizobium lusitanum]MBB6485725.1 lipoprotein-anchoring transpeptidase ErfK/SrfK [Rhizobium lusitanum]
MSRISSTLSRRTFIFGSLAASATLAGCSTVPQTGPGDQAPLKTPLPTIKPVVEPEVVAPAPAPATSPEVATRYAQLQDGGFTIPAIPYEKIDPKYYRQQVVDPTGEPAGTVVVDTASRFLYLVQPGGKALRYGVGIGREGFAWKGEGTIHWRQHWPRWKPPTDMIARQPGLAKFSVANGGMAPGLKNPLGARALYIFQDGKDTLYRLHGTPDWRSIGKATSSGCVRLINQDAIDLYERIPYHARIVVYQTPLRGTGA